jgi:phenylalanyl-tRNA synthetase beta chain
MNVSYRWLSEFFPEGAFDALGPKELARGLTMIGLPVDEVRLAFAAFAGVVVGKVVAARPHPSADRLTLCTVIAGDGEREVVCGAPNVEIGGIYGYAPEGARLPGDRKIRRVRIRGTESAGMLCSAPELGLETLGSAEGIWRIPGLGDADLGRDLREVLGLDDWVFVVEVPSNRGDALSHLGIAREAQWLVEAPCNAPASGVHERGELSSASSRASVLVEDREGCSSYLGRLIDGVTVGPSPAWIQLRLIAVGARPVSNVVDATNYVMLECGQPLHPFDFDRLAGGRVMVRKARLGERFTTLDGKVRELDPAMTMIADAERAVAVGGVMGGLDSEVTEDTKTVFLESAYFDPARTARTARKLGISSEAATRFSRGVDPALTAYALDRATRLMAEVAGGSVAPGRVGVEWRQEPRYVALRLSRVSALIGLEVEPSDSRRALETLGFEITVDSAGTWGAAIPTWRFDVSREVDMVEEIARLMGYDRVPLAPLPRPAVGPARSAAERAVERLAAGARGAGFDEARTPSFVGENVLGPGYPIDKMVEIRNPISKTERFLRPFLVTTLGRAAAFNVARGARRVKLFEIGHAFHSLPGAPCEERRTMGLAAAGWRFLLDWSQAEPPAYDFYDLKGDVEDIIEGAVGWRPGFIPGSRPFLHPGRQAEILDAAGRPIGFCGELQPRAAEAWGIEQPLYVAEWDVAVFGQPMEVESTAVPREPSVERDLAVVVPDGVSSATVIAVVRAAELNHLTEVEVFDVYRGPQITAGHISLGLRLTFQADRTLTDAEVDREVGRLIQRLAGEHGFRLR